MELRLPLEVSPGREADCRAVFGTWVFFRTMHGKTAPSCGLHSQGGVRRGVRASGSYQEGTGKSRSEEHTSELQSLTNLVCRLLLEKKKDELLQFTINKQSKLLQKIPKRVNGR